MKLDPRSRAASAAATTADSLTARAPSPSPDAGGGTDSVTANGDAFSGSVTAPSPLMQAIYDGVRAKGNLPPELARTQGIPDPGVVLGNSPIFKSHGDAIASAHAEVLHQTFNWRSSEDAQELCAGIKQLEVNRKALAATGVPVAPIPVVLVTDDMPKVVWKVFNASMGQGDGNGALTNLESMKKDLAALDLDPRYVKIIPLAATHWGLNSQHAKSTVIDNDIALVTGANPQWNRVMNWFDAAYTFRGDVVRSLRADIVALAHRLSPTLALPEAPAPRPLEGEPQVPMLIASRPAVALPTVRARKSAQNDAFHALFTNAQTELNIVSPNLNFRPVVRDLVNAARRGVRVQVVLGKGFNDTAEARWLLQGGTNAQVVARIHRKLAKEGLAHNFEVRWYSADGEDPVFGATQDASHAKFAAADGHVAIVGSGNLDTQSGNNSRELNVVVDDAATTRSWKTRVFDPVWGRAIKISPPPIGKSRVMLHPRVVP